MRALVLFFLLPLTCPAQTDCSLELDKDSIQVYTCKRPDSRYKSVQASFQLNATLAEVAAAILDVDHYDAWQYKTLSARVVKQISDREMVYYTQVEAPLLTQDRDFVIRLTLDPDPMTKGLMVEAVSLPDYLPPVEDVVRVPYSRARWNIMPGNKGKVNVEYTIDIDLGGSVPAWVVNMVAPKAPYETFNALRSVIGNYKGKGVGFIE